MSKNHLLIDGNRITEIRYQQQRLQGIYKLDSYSEEERMDIYLDPQKREIRKDLIKSQETDFYFNENMKHLTEDRQQEVNSQIKSKKMTNSIISNSVKMKFLNQSVRLQNKEVLFDNMEHIKDRKELADKINQYEKKYEQLVFNREELGNFSRVIDIDFLNKEKRLKQLRSKYNMFRKDKYKSDFRRFINNAKPLMENVEKFTMELNQLREEILQQKDRQYIKEQKNTKSSVIRKIQSKTPSNIKNHSSFDEFEEETNFSIK